MRAACDDLPLCFAAALIPPRLIRAVHCLLPPARCADGASAQIGTMDCTGKGEVTTSGGQIYVQGLGGSADLNSGGGQVEVRAGKSQAGYQ